MAPLILGVDRQYPGMLIMSVTSNTHPGGTMSKRTNNAKTPRKARTPQHVMIARRKNREKEQRKAARAAANK